MTVRIVRILEALAVDAVRAGKEKIDPLWAASFKSLYQKRPPTVQPSTVT